MATDTENVKRLIAQAIDHQAKTQSNFIEVLKAAWIELRDQRQEPGRSVDLDLAGAEHYLFARYLVAAGEVREGQMTMIVRGYYYKKRLDLAKGNPNAMAATDNPVSAPDIDVKNWGLQGAKDGAADHTTYHVARQAPLWRPIDKLMGGSGVYGSGFGTGSPAP